MVSYRWRGAFLIIIMYIMAKDTANKLTKKQKKEQALTDAFLKEIDTVQKKHGLHFVAVLNFTQAAIQPSFTVQRIPEQKGV